MPGVTGDDDDEELASDRDVDGRIDEVLGFVMRAVASVVVVEHDRDDLHEADRAAGSLLGLEVRLAVDERAQILDRNLAAIPVEHGVEASRQARARLPIAI